jgi:rubrerythrin
MSARGFSTMLQALRSDLEFERAAVRLYAEYAKRLDDPLLKEMLREFARAESGHVRGIGATIDRIEARGYPAVFFCPVCGWELDLGVEPADDVVTVCPMCSVSFVLELRDGDYVLQQPEA